MKIRVTMKDPDCLDGAINEAVITDVAKLALPPDDAEAVLEARMEKARDVCARWFRWGEYLTVEIDTETKTATVIPETP